MSFVRQVSQEEVLRSAQFDLLRPGSKSSLIQQPDSSCVNHGESIA